MDQASARDCQQTHINGRPLQCSILQDQLTAHIESVVAKWGPDFLDRLIAAASAAAPTTLRGAGAAAAPHQLRLTVGSSNGAAPGSLAAAAADDNHMYALRNAMAAAQADRRRFAAPASTDNSGAADTVRSTGSAGGGGGGGGMGIGMGTSGSGFGPVAPTRRGAGRAAVATDAAAAAAGVPLFYSASAGGNSAAMQRMAFLSEKLGVPLESLVRLLRDVDKSSLGGPGSPGRGHRYGQGQATEGGGQGQVRGVAGAHQDHRLEILPSRIQKVHVADLPNGQLPDLETLEREAAAQAAAVLEAAAADAAARYGVSPRELELGSGDGTEDERARTDFELGTETLTETEAGTTAAVTAEASAADVGDDAAGAEMLLGDAAGGVSRSSQPGEGSQAPSRRASQGMVELPGAGLHSAITAAATQPAVLAASGQLPGSTGDSAAASTASPAASTAAAAAAAYKPGSRMAAHAHSGSATSTATASAAATAAAQAAGLLRQGGLISRRAARHMATTSELTTSTAANARSYHAADAIGGAGASGAEGAADGGRVSAAGSGSYFDAPTSAGTPRGTACGALPGVGAGGNMVLAATGALALTSPAGNAAAAAAAAPPDFPTYHHRSGLSFVALARPGSCMPHGPTLDELQPVDPAKVAAEARSRAMLETLSHRHVADAAAARRAAAATKAGGGGTSSGGSTSRDSSAAHQRAGDQGVAHHGSGHGHSHGHGHLGRKKKGPVIMEMGPDGNLHVAKPRGASPAQPHPASAGTAAGAGAGVQTMISEGHERRRHEKGGRQRRRSSAAGDGKDTDGQVAAGGGGISETYAGELWVGVDDEEEVQVAQVQEQSHGAGRRKRRSSSAGPGRPVSPGRTARSSGTGGLPLRSPIQHAGRPGSPPSGPHAASATGTPATTAHGQGHEHTQGPAHAGRSRHGTESGSHPRTSGSGHVSRGIVTGLRRLSEVAEEVGLRLGTPGTAGSVGGGASRPGSLGGGGAAGLKSMLIGAGGARSDTAVDLLDSDDDEVEAEAQYDSRAAAAARLDAQALVAGGWLGAAQATEDGYAEAEAEAEAAAAAAVGGPITITLGPLPVWDCEVGDTTARAGAMAPASAGSRALALGSRPAPATMHGRGFSGPGAASQPHAPPGEAEGADATGAPGGLRGLSRHYKVAAEVGRWNPAAPGALRPGYGTHADYTAG